MNRTLETTKGTIQFPVYMPVTTYGKYPIDDLIRPYLPRFTQCIMVSHYYAQAMKKPPEIPLFIDSGGFASLFQDSEIVEDGDFATIITGDGTFLDPESVLEFQINHSQIGATLDFLISPNMDVIESRYRQELTIRNAVWAIEQDRPDNFKLFASVQAWDRRSAIDAMSQLKPFDFDGFALGGMVPRVSDPNTIYEIVTTIREVEHKRPIHVFGVGKPDIVCELFSRGVDSIDSSTYIQHAINKKMLCPATGAYGNPTMSDDCGCPICSRFDTTYLQLTGELNSMTLALHNLCMAAGLSHPVHKCVDPLD